MKIPFTPSSAVPGGCKPCFISSSHSTFLWVEPWAFLGLEGVHSYALVSSTRNWRWQEHLDLGGWDAMMYQISSSLLTQGPCQIVPGDAGSQPFSGPYFCSPCYQRAWGSGSYLAPSGWITEWVVLLPQSLSCAINKPHVYFLMLLKWALGIWASWQVQSASIRCLVRALHGWLLSEAIWSPPAVFWMWLNFNSKGCICWFSGFSFLPASLPA